MTADEFWEGWKGFTLPKVKAVWPTLASDNIVSVQPMSAPVSQSVYNPFMPVSYIEPFVKTSVIDNLDDIIKEIMNNFNRITEALLYETN
jgi:hypothetical protein